MKVGIVGLGLIGGSLARDLRDDGCTVFGVDRDPTTVRRAVDENVIAGALDPASVDAVVLAVPVRAAPAWLDTLAPDLAPGAVITDVGSTKRSVMAAAAASGLADRFVGAHPVAGDHRSGWTAGRLGLFRDRRVWICRGGAGEGAVEEVESLWRRVGGTPRRIEAADHDRMLAWASHLPQVTTSALAAALAAAGVGRQQLGPGGLDATRIAGSSPPMWLDILADNADLLGPALDALIAELSAVRGAIADGDGRATEALLRRGQEWSAAGG